MPSPLILVHVLETQEVLKSFQFAPPPAAPALATASSTSFFRSTSGTPSRSFKMDAATPASGRDKVAPGGGGREPAGDAQAKHVEKKGGFRLGRVL